MGRRDSSDERWQELKKKITKRDRKICRLSRILTVQEVIMITKKAPQKLLEKLDHAHVLSVGCFPHMCYNDKNVVLLNRWSHENLDNCKSPITGENITKEERDDWWKKIIGEQLFSELEEKAYPRSLKGEIEMEETKVILDGTEVTQEKLQEEKKRKDIRIIEEETPNTFKSLKKLQE